MPLNTVKLLDATNQYRNTLSQNGHNVLLDDYEIKDIAVKVVWGHQQCDGTECAYASDSDNFDCNIFDLVVVQKRIMPICESISILIGYI